MIVLKVVLCFLAIGGGIFLCAFGFTTPMGHPVSTICGLLGLMLGVGGGLFLILLFTDSKPSAEKK